ncbi:MAG TPA: AIR synthase-related protein [Candidatus Acidoferrum sp.]|nr:AIR synthase-related protein [Candidatus Acidoferrum sp.]
MPINHGKRRASNILYEAAKQTWVNRAGRIGEVSEVFPDFSSFRAIPLRNLPSDAVMSAEFEGTGSKPEIAERVGYHGTVAHDLFAMACDDAVRRGGEPAVIGSVLDVNGFQSSRGSHLGMIMQLAEGTISAAREARVAVINGEVADLGPRVRGVGPFNYNWSAGVIWFARTSRMLRGNEIKNGDKIVALREEGFRSNGLTLLRKTMQNAYGSNWTEQELDGRTIGEQALHPSRIYTKAVVDMVGGVAGEPMAEVHGISHVTGGGLPEKLRRALMPSGLGARITDPMVPCGLMIHCQEIGNISDREAYMTWNMGQGMCIFTPNPADVERVAGRHNIRSKVIGEVTTEPTIVIQSRGAFSPQAWEKLVFPIREEW